MHQPMKAQILVLLVLKPHREETILLADINNATGTLSNPELQDLKFRSLCCAVEEMSLRLG